MDRVPNPEFGNTLTVRQYQTEWQALHQQIAGGNLPTDGCLLAGGGGTADIGTAIPVDVAPLTAYAQAQLGKPNV